MAQVGGYIVVQDSNVNRHPLYKDHGPGPMEAVEDFLNTTGGFQPDREIERLLHTTDAKGYLKRVRQA